MSEKNFVALKGRFQSITKRFYGLFLIIFNKETDAIDTASVIVSLDSQIYELLPSSTPSEFDTSINKIKYEGQYALSATQNLQTSLKNIMSDTGFYRDVKEHIESGNSTNLLPIIKDFFGKVLDDKNLILEMEMERASESDVSFETTAEVSGEEITDINLSEEDDPAYSADSGEDSKESAPKDIVFDLSFVLAPVGGKLVNSLSIGDVVMVRILPNSPPANHYIDSNKLRTEKRQIIPVPGEVRSIKEEDGRIEVMVKIAERVLGRVYEEEKVLVKMHSRSGPSYSQTSTSSNTVSKTGSAPTSEEKKASSLLLIGLLLSAILIFLIALVFYT